MASIAEYNAPHGDSFLPDDSFGGLIERKYNEVRDAGFKKALVMATTSPFVKGMLYMAAAIVGGAILTFVGGYAMGDAKPTGYTANITNALSAGTSQGFNILFSVGGALALATAGVANTGWEWKKERDQVHADLEKARTRGKSQEREMAPMPRAQEPSLSEQQSQETMPGEKYKSFLQAELARRAARENGNEGRGYV